MEEKLTNPYFLGARAWNGGADNWVGDNTIFPNDIPAHQTRCGHGTVTGACVMVCCMR